MGYTEVFGFVDDSLQLVNDLIDAFTNGGSTSWYTEIEGINNSSRRASLLESTTNVDPLLSTDATQVHRILIDATVSSGEATSFSISWGTDLDMPTIATVRTDIPKIDVWNATTRPTSGRVWYGRVTIVERGFVFSIHQNMMVDSGGKGAAMLCIQRPVNPQTGATKVDGRAPIFALDIEPGRADGSEVAFSVVRENDVTAATAQTNIGFANEDALYKINLLWSHPAIDDNANGVFKFPFGLSTPRHLYMDEMDLIVFGRADTYIFPILATITKFSAARDYEGQFGLFRSGSSETATTEVGARLGILFAGGGV